MARNLYIVCWHCHCQGLSALAIGVTLVQFSSPLQGGEIKYIFRRGGEMIKVDSLAKSFGTIRAVDGISFSVERGEILGFLGPNGAGKSTTMKMITTFLPPTAGTVSVGGFDILEDPIKVRSSLGFLPESAPSYRDMKVYDFLDFAAEVRGFDGKERAARVVETIEQCNLTDVAYQLIDTLSKGYRQRVGFAQALIHNPDYLILDEPTDGLDPNQKQEVRSLIKRMGREKCIILSTHILEEMEAVCSRAIVIANGRIVADDTPDGLKSHSVLHNAVTLELNDIDPWAIMGELRNIQGVGRVENVRDDSLGAAGASTADSDIADGGVEKGENGEQGGSGGKSKVDGKGARGSVRVRLFPEQGKSIAHETARFIHEKGWNVEGFRVESGDMNEVFRKLTAGGAA